MHIIDINLKFLIIIFKIVAEMLWSRRESTFDAAARNYSALFQTRPDQLIRVPAHFYHVFLPL
jgi:hypothetical protein